MCGRQAPITKPKGRHTLNGQHTHLEREPAPCVGVVPAVRPRRLSPASDQELLTREMAREGGDGMPPPPLLATLGLPGPDPDPPPPSLFGPKPPTLLALRRKPGCAAAPAKTEGCVAVGGMRGYKCVQAGFRDNPSKAGRKNIVAHMTTHLRSRSEIGLSGFKPRQTVYQLR